MFFFYSIVNRQMSTLLCFDIPGVFEIPDIGT